MSVTPSQFKKYTASGSAAGYLFQPEVALKMLSEADADAEIAIEADDDVAERIDDSTTQRAQLKHQIEPHSAFTDSSQALWKTLSIWIEAAVNGEFDASQCKLLLVTNGRVSNCFIRKVVESRSKKDRKTLVDQMLNRTFSETVEPYVKVVRKHNRRIVHKVFDCIQIVDSHTLNKATYKNRTMANLQLTLTEEHDYVYQGLLGWIHANTIEMWRQKRPAWISKKNFSNHYQTLLRRLSLYKKIGLPAHLISVSSTARDSEINRLYVQQLRAVKADEETISDAILDFVRCNTERARLAMEGDATADDWIEFDSSLTRYWSKKEKVSRLSPQKTQEETGIALYFEMLLHEAEIGGLKMQQYLTHGTFHRLSNNLDVGWHPRYRELFGDGR